MKELSIEDKAKAYDELIKRLNKAREDVGGYTFKSVYDEVMSELAESEDEKFLRYLIDCCKDTIESDDKGLELSMVTTKRLFAWLKKQGEKGINGKNREIPFSEQKPAWSEEDEKYLIYNIEQDYRDKLNNNPPESLRPYYNKVISWLKSIRHQKQWKPSDEQIKALKDACDEHWEPDGLNPLYTLYQELKKLREN